MLEEDIEMEDSLKVFIWKNFAPDYSSGLAFAIAKNEVDAKNMVVKELGHPYIEGYEWGSVEILDLVEGTAAGCTGGA